LSNPCKGLLACQYFFLTWRHWRHPQKFLSPFSQLVYHKIWHRKTTRHLGFKMNSVKTHKFSVKQKKIFLKVYWLANIFFFNWRHWKHPQKFISPFSQLVYNTIWHRKTIRHVGFKINNVQSHHFSVQPLQRFIGLQIFFLIGDIEGTHRSLFLHFPN